MVSSGSGSRSSKGRGPTRAGGIQRPGVRGSTRDIVLGAIACSWYGACASDDDDAGGEATVGNINVAMQPGGAAASGGTITVVMTDNKYTPNKIEVEAGKEIAVS